MKKIILSKIDFVKAIFTNISIHALEKFLNNIDNLTKYIANIPVLILNNNLIETGNDSSNGSLVLTIIGQIDYKKLKEKKLKHLKGSNIIDKKTSTKIVVLKSKNRQLKNGQNSQKNNKIKPKQTPKPAISISKEQKLISSITTITPNINRKNKLILGEMHKQKEKAKQTPAPSNKVQSSTKIAPKIVNQPIKKQNKTKTPEIYIPGKEKAKENTNKTNEIKNNSKPNQIKTPKYSLQKKKSPGLIAVFSVAFIPFLLGLGLAKIISHKKTFPNMLIASSMAILGFGIFANTKQKNNKQLVKKR